MAVGPVTVKQLLGVRLEVLDDLRQRGVTARVCVPYRPGLVPLLDSPPGRILKRIGRHTEPAMRGPGPSPRADGREEPTPTPVRDPR